MEEQKESSQGGCIQSYEHVFFRKEKKSSKPVIVVMSISNTIILFFMKHGCIVFIWMLYGAYEERLAILNINLDLRCRYSGGDFGN